MGVLLWMHLHLIWTGQRDLARAFFIIALVIGMGMVLALWMHPPI